MLVHYLAIDPGKTNGLAAYNRQAELLWLKEVNVDNLAEFLEDYLEGVEVVILEDYKIYPQKKDQHVYSDVVTARAIGRVESWVERNKIKLIKQGANFKTMGFKYLGTKEPPKSATLSHAIVAHAHGTYWLVRNGKLDPRELLK